MPSDPSGATVDATQEQAGTEVVLSVVVPVYNQAAGITGNLAEIERRVEAGFDRRFEIVLVSDGSDDHTEDHALQHESSRVRVFHYDRNLGKGYAVKLGARESRGRFVACVDADLDLDPAAIPGYLRLAEEQQLDFVVGSKRHPLSEVSYPRSRRVASWAYQQLVRVLFRLDVRDTQVGLKLFRREVADDVMPLLIVKRFAFDLELLAVARSLGFDRIQEQPVRLDYQFTGSGVRSLAVLRALVDTLAIFYRLRILRYYERKRRVMGRLGAARPRTTAALVSLVCSRTTAESVGDHERLEIVTLEQGASLHEAARRSHGDVLAIIARDGRIAGNFLSATVPLLEHSEVPAVVVPALAPLAGPVAARAAAAVQESRLGGGGSYFRFMPGNIRRVGDFPAESLVIRRDAYLGLPADIPTSAVCAALAAQRTQALYTPETVVVVAPAPLFRPHLRAVAEHGLRRGRSLRRWEPGALRPSTLGALGFVAFAVALGPAVLLGGAVLDLWVALGLVYAVALVVTAVGGAARFRSLRVGAVALAGVVATHAVFALSFLRGLVAL